MLAPLIHGSAGTIGGILAVGHEKTIEGRRSCGCELRTPCRCWLSVAAGVTSGTESWLLLGDLHLLVPSVHEHQARVEARARGLQTTSSEEVVCRPLWSPCASKFLLIPPPVSLASSNDLRCARRVTPGRSNRRFAQVPLQGSGKSQALTWGVESCTPSAKPYVSDTYGSFDGCNGVRPALARLSPRPSSSSPVFLLTLL